MPLCVGVGEADIDARRSFRRKAVRRVERLRSLPELHRRQCDQMRRGFRRQSHGQIETVGAEEVGDIGKMRAGGAIDELAGQRAEVPEKRELPRPIFPKPNAGFHVETVALRRPEGDRPQRGRLALELVSARRGFLQGNAETGNIFAVTSRIAVLEMARASELGNSSAKRRCLSCTPLCVRRKRGIPSCASLSTTTRSTRRVPRICTRSGSISSSDNDRSICLPRDQAKRGPPLRENL